MSIAEGDAPDPFRTSVKKGQGTLRLLIFCQKWPSVVWVINGSRT